jgi:hypothetical protein
MSDLSSLAKAATALARPLEVAMGRTLSGGSLPDPPHTSAAAATLRIAGGGSSSLPVSGKATASTTAAAIAFVTSSPGAIRADGRRVLAGEHLNPLVQAVTPFKSLGLTVEYGEIYLQVGKGYYPLKDELLQDRFNLPPIKNLVAELKKSSNRDARIFLQTYLDPCAWKILVALL